MRGQPSSNQDTNSQSSTTTIILALSVLCSLPTTATILDTSTQAGEEMRSMLSQKLCSNTTLFLEGIGLTPLLAHGETMIPNGEPSDARDSRVIREFMRRVRG